MTRTKSKYDLFFSKSLEHSALAQAFFTQHMPTHLKPYVQFDTLERADRTNTDDTLKQRHRDIIYKTGLQENHTLFICAEHQSRADWLMPLRFLRYNADVLAAYVEQHQKWPLIINILFYQGVKSPYPYPKEAYQYYENPLWGKQELTLRFAVIDISQFSDKEILTHGLVGPMELLLKHGRKANFELEVAAYQPLFHRCIGQLGDGYITTMLSYATALSNRAVGKKLFDFIEEVLTEKKELVMTYAQQLRNEGMQKGMQRGMQKGVQKGMQKGMQKEKYAIAQSMLKDGEPFTRIMKWTGLSKEALQKLQ